jgi:hypothetical protein
MTATSKQAMLLSYYVDEVIHWTEHLLIPTAYLFVLGYAKVKELGTQLRLYHAYVLISTIL